MTGFGGDGDGGGAGGGVRGDDESGGKTAGSKTRLRDGTGLKTGHHEGVCQHAEMHAVIVIYVWVFINMVIRRRGRGGGRRVGGGILFRRGWNCVRHRGDPR
jgi:hypothetical protein